MNDEEKINKIQEITRLIKSKEIEKAERELKELEDNTEKVEINQYGQIFDFENETQFILYCKMNKKWKKIGQEIMLLKYIISKVLFNLKNKIIEKQ